MELYLGGSVPKQVQSLYLLNLYLAEISPAWSQVHFRLQCFRPVDTKPLIVNGTGIQIPIDLWGPWGPLVMSFIPRL